MTMKILRRRLLGLTAATVAAGLGHSAVAASVTPPAADASSKADWPVIGGRRRLGTGTAAMDVTPLGFGCMGSSYNRGAVPSRDKLIALFRQAFEHGVNFFDTAQIYGPLTNEELTGEALEPFRGRVQIATKFGHRIENGHYFKGELNSRPENIRRVCEESLKRLRIEVIDLFYQHRLDPNVPIEDVAGTVADLIREGKVKHFGLCEVGPQTLRRAHAVCPVTALQSEYHLMWRQPEANVFSTLRELGIGFVPYSPLNRGFLGGCINEYTVFDPAHDNRQNLPRFSPENLRANYRIVEVLNRFGRPRGMTAAQVSLAWLLSKGEFIVPIPGTTKMSHLEENLRAANFLLPAADWKALEAELDAIAVQGERYPASEQAQVSAG